MESWRSKKSWKSELICSNGEWPKKYCRPKLHIMRPSLIKNSEKRFMMSQKIILALDESDNSMKAVNYVEKIVKSDDKITLFSVLPSPTAACSLEEILL